MPDGSMTTDELRDIVQDAHLNFLLGAGASADLLSPLGNIEQWLEQLAIDGSSDHDLLAQVRASVYAYYFEGAIAPNKLIRNEADPADKILTTYRSFLRTINTLLVRRRSSILEKQVNVFTTNVDIAIEVASEQLQIELNDGFTGRYLPLFSTTNFGTVKSRRSLQYDNLSEVPTFNLLKLHGSVSWVTRTIDSGGSPRAVIGFDQATDRLDVVAELMAKAELFELDPETDLSALLAEEAPTASESKQVRAFMDGYEQLSIVNPTKDKFGLTVLNQNYYDLLRVFSNSLEKENSVLFIIGFSCRDEHIRELITRAARTNPTLQVVVFAFKPGEVDELKERLQADLAPNRNIVVLGPPPAGEGEVQDTYSLLRVNEVFFEPLLPTAPRKPDTVVDIRLKLAPTLERDDDE